MPANEEIEPLSKSKIKMDFNQYRYDYENDRNLQDDKITSEKLLESMVEEAQKVNSKKWKLLKLWIIHKFEKYK